MTVQIGGSMPMMNRVGPTSPTRPLSPLYREQHQQPVSSPTPYSQVKKADEESGATATRPRMNHRGGILNMRKIKYFYFIILIHYASVMIDIAINVFGGYLRNDFYDALGLASVQVVFVGMNIGLFFISFTTTYLFKAGALWVLCKEFHPTLLSASFYIICLLPFHALRLIRIWDCSPATCDVWTSDVTNAYIVVILVSTLYCWGLVRGIERICDPKYYADTVWFRSVTHMK